MLGILERYQQREALSHLNSEGIAVLRSRPPALQLGFLSEEAFDRVVDPAKMGRPYVAT